MSFGGKKTKTHTESNSKIEPYAPTIPYYPEILGEAQRLYQDPNIGASYGPSAVPGFSGATKEALGGIESRARSGNPYGLLDAAQQGLKGTIEGSYLNANPGAGTYNAFMSGAYATPQSAQFTDPSNAFYAALRDNGYTNPGAVIYGGIAGRTANTDAMPYYDEIAAMGRPGGAYEAIGGLTARSGSLPGYDAAASMRASGGAIPLYDQIGMLGADTSGLNAFQALSGLSAREGARPVYDDIGGARAREDALGLYSDIGNIGPSQTARGRFEDIAGRTATTPSNSFYEGLVNNGVQNAARPGLEAYAAGNFDQGQGRNAFSSLVSGDYVNPDDRALSDYLTPFASGQYLSRDTNPYVSAMADEIQQRISEQVGGAMGASNRYGSGAHQSVLARETGSALNSFLGDMYERDRSRQLSAAETLAGLGEQRAARGLEAVRAGGIGLEDVRGRDLATQLQALGDLTAEQYQDLQTRIGGADRLAGEAARADEFSAENAFRAATGIEGMDQRSDALRLSAASTAAGGVANTQQFADQFNIGAQTTQAEGIRAIEQFADQFGADNLSRSAEGQRLIRQFADTFGLEALGTSAEGRRLLDQFGDEFNLNATLSGTEGRRLAEQFGDEYRLSALGQGAEGSRLALGQGAEGRSALNAFADQFGLDADQIAASGLSDAALAQINARFGAGQAASESELNRAAQALNISNADRTRLLQAAGLADDSYMTERSNQLNSFINAPVLEAADYADLDQLLRSGAIRDDLATRQAQERQARYQFENNLAPYAKLQEYLNSVATVGGLGRQGSEVVDSVTKQKGDALSGILGGAMALGSAFIPGLGAMSGAMGAASQPLLNSFFSQPSYSSPASYGVRSLFPATGYNR